MSRSEVSGAGSAGRWEGASRVLHAQGVIVRVDMRVGLQPWVLASRRREQTVSGDGQVVARLRQG